jgi:hypothetical protein
MSKQELPTTGHEAVKRMESIFSRNGYKRSQSGSVILFTCEGFTSAFQLSLLYNGDHGFMLIHPDFTPSSWNCTKCFHGGVEYSESDFFEHMETMVKKFTHIGTVR